MKLYQQPVILFGLVIPTLLAIAVFSASMMIRGKVETKLDEKIGKYAQLQQTRRAVKEIESIVSTDREHLARWENQLSEETASVVTTNMRAISERLPGREFQQTSFERPTGTAGFGSASAQKSSQIRLSFRGTYRSIQHAFLELETRMPQLQLQELRISPNVNQPSMHNVQVSYTAWED